MTITSFRIYVLLPDEYYSKASLKKHFIEAAVQSCLVSLLVSMSLVTCLLLLEFFIQMTIEFSQTPPKSRQISMSDPGTQHSALQKPAY